MARQKYPAPHEILVQSLEPGESILVLANGARLCPEYKMNGLVTLQHAIGHAITHKIRGGTWWAGAWAITNRYLRYVSRRQVPMIYGTHVYDVSIPRKQVVAVTPGGGSGRTYDVLHTTGTIRLHIKKSAEADGFAAALRSVAIR